MIVSCWLTHDRSCYLHYNVIKVTTNRKPSSLLKFEKKSSLRILEFMESVPLRPHDWKLLVVGFYSTHTLGVYCVRRTSRTQSVSVCGVRYRSNRAPFFVFLLLLSNAHVSDVRDWPVVKIFWKSNMVLQRSKNAQFSTITVRQTWSVSVLESSSRILQRSSYIRMRSTRCWPKISRIRLGAWPTIQRVTRRRFPGLEALQRRTRPKVFRSVQRLNMSNAGV